MQYISSKEVAERWGLTVRSVQYFCKQGRIPGAIFLGKQWMIPFDACQPQDKRLAGKSDAADDEYRFPLFIFSSAYASADSLTDMEKKLLDAQSLLLKEDQFACICHCTNLIRKSTPTYILMGIWFSIAMAAIPIGNHPEYRRAMNAMESILKSEKHHQEDYRLLINYAKFQIEFSRLLFETINISDLSNSALPFYQFFLLFSSLFIVDINPDVIRFSEAALRLIHTEGIFPLETVMQFTLGSCYVKQSEPAHSLIHIEPACRTALENNWIRIPAKYSVVVEAPLRKCLGPKEYEKIRKIGFAGVAGQRLISQIESGNSLFYDASPEQLAVMYQIYFGSSYDNICSDLQISPAELKNVLMTCYQVTGTKNRKELKKFLKTKFSSYLMN